MIVYPALAVVLALIDPYIPPAQKSTIRRLSNGTIPPKSKMLSFHTSTFKFCLISSSPASLKKSLIASWSVAASFPVT